MPDLEKIMSVASADIEKIMGVERADIEKVMGVTMPSLSDWKGSRAFYMGGWYYNSVGTLTNSNHIQYKTMTTDGNMADFGDLTKAVHNFKGSGSNGTRVLRGGGDANTEANNADQVTVDYFTAASTIDASDAGDLETGGNRGGPNGASNGTLCMFMGGETYPGEGSPNYSRDLIEYQNIGTTGGSSGGGNLTAASYSHESSNGDTKSLILNISTNANGQDDSAIDEHNFSTSANATDYGSLVKRKGVGYGTGIMCSTTRVVFGGGLDDSWAKHNEVHYVPVASSSDSTDAMDLVRSASQLCGTSDGTRGEIYGGNSEDGGAGSANFNRNTIQKFTLASLSGTASDIGDLANEDNSSATDYSEAGGVGWGGAQTAL